MFDNDLRFTLRRGDGRTVKVSGLRYGRRFKPFTVKVSRDGYVSWCSDWSELQACSGWSGLPFYVMSSSANAAVHLNPYDFGRLFPEDEEVADVGP